jgi:hypothetical protein
MSILPDMVYRMSAKTISFRDKVFVANDRGSLVSIASELRQDKTELFFKCRPCYYEMYTGSKDCYKEHVVEFGKEGMRLHIKGADDGYGMTPEFAMLSRIHGAFPDNVATPIAFIRRGEPEKGSIKNSVNGYPAVGYLTEYISSKDLEAYQENARSGNPEMVKEFVTLLNQLIGLLNGLNARGIGHGDAHFGNVMVADGGVLKLIDPLPAYSNMKHSIAYAIDEDMYVAAYAKRILKRIEENGRPD